MNLADLTRSAVGEFLNTVLIVDERFEYEVETTTAVRPPGLAGAAEESDGHRVDEASSDPLVPAQKLVDAFASKGLFATPFKPLDVPISDLIPQVEQLAVGADIVVLDWHIYEDDGDRAVAIVERLLETDANQRTRLVVFYTGQQLDRVESKLQRKLDLPAFHDGSSSKEALRVVVLSKADSTVVLEEDPRRVSGKRPTRSTY